MTSPAARLARAAGSALRRPVPGGRPLAEFIHNELVGGVVLAAATVVALT
jgi:hypothetical protein